METLRLKPRQPVEDDFDNWDDDDFFIDNDNLTFQSQSTSASQPPTNRRDSYSSLRSDFESVHGEEEKQVHLPGDDEKSTLSAIAAAARAGIPIPTSVPPSALLGGTIKRLGGRKIKKIIQEDWDDDIEIPELGQSLSLKPQDGSKFPDILRQVSGSAQPSPSKAPRLSTTVTISEETTPAKRNLLAGTINLDRFRDMDDDDDLFGNGAATIKVAKTRPALKAISITPPTPDPKKVDVANEDFETDFELPNDGELKLSTNRDIPKTPSSNTLEDFDWGEGSLGTRFGGTRRDGRSNRSSSVSALSPSVTSSLTAESEDEALDGLLLPNGPVNFGARLKFRKDNRSPERIPEVSPKTIRPALPVDIDRDDFLAGLDIGEGEVFDSRKLTLHRNLQVKDNRPSSPTRPKTAVALKFTNKPVVVSRLPRPMGPLASHDRSQAYPPLEPVSESGGPIPQTRRSLSRLGHSAQSSISSIPTPTTPCSVQSLPPSTPSRREIVQKTSTASLREGPTTTSAQLLRLKRSMPVLRQQQSPARTTGSRGSYDRPPSRTEFSYRPLSSLRPKTPVDRPRTVESAAAMARKPPIPSLSAGASAHQSHNLVAKTSRTFRRHDSDPAIEFRPSSRAVSRSTMRSPSPRKYRTAERIAQEGAWRQLSKPRRSRQFGDGNELDGFDDLPTSSQAEARFMKQPIGAGPPRSQLRNKLYQNILPDRNTPSPHSTYYAPYSPAKSEYVPSFARDTTASRIARETNLAQRAPSTGPLAPLTTQRVAQLSMRGNLNPNPLQSSIRSKKLRRPPQLKPHLIANLNPPRESKMVNGMFYNPDTFRWEGNDNVLNAFEVPASSPSTASLPPFMLHREKENSTPRPALITNIGATKGVQVVGGMVFDPQNMCWLKLGPQTSKTELTDPLDRFNALDDEEDVFRDIPDLEDHAHDSSGEGGKTGRVSDVKDDWLVGEEFDVGPEFVRRQREEEDRWRRKCESWVQPRAAQGVGHQQRDSNAWKWAIRDIVHATIHD